MRNSQEQNWWKRIAHSYFGLGILSILILFFAWNVIKFAGKAEGTAKNKRIAEEKLENLHNQKNQLEGEINELSTQKGMEASIREKFGLAKEGEGLVVVVDEKSHTEGETGQESNFWNKIKNWFKRD